jgi:hypothetical protein
VVLAIAAVGLDGLALTAAESDGGRGWAFAFPCVCLNGLASPFCASVAAYFAIVSLSRHRGRDGIAWLALVLAAGAAAGAMLILKWSGEAVSAV